MAPETNEIRERVRERYGQVALRVVSGGGSSCCGSGPSLGEADPVTGNLYADGERAVLPEQALTASLGCGNPTALATLRAGEVVLDLGSGGGIDVLLSARRVGETGKVYGLDMTEEMLTLARSNAARAGATNVEFLKGHIEEIPLPAASVDVILSNCVINLSADKAQVLREAFRVLRPGGRFAVSDIVVKGELPAEVRRSMELWAGCVAGALEEGEFHGLLAAAGFEEIDIEVTRTYSFDEASAILADSGLDARALAGEISGRVVSAFVRARKPEQG